MNIIKNTKKDSKKKHVKEIKIFLEEEKDKKQKEARERYQSLSEEEKEKKVLERKKSLPDYIKNYYLKHKK